MKTIKTALLLLVCILLVFPAAQNHFHLINERDLDGYYTPKPPPDLRKLSKHSWLSGTFQDEFISSLSDHTGFHNSLTRLNCQVDYSLFGITHAPGFITGKSGTLFEEDYIREYNGDFFIGERVIHHKVKLLKDVQDSLKANGVPLVVVFEPGKATYFPEYFPNRYQKRPGRSNYQQFIASSTSVGLKHIDLNRLFLEMKDTVRYPLFPKYGMHWSLYGVAKAMDTLAGALEADYHIQMPDFHVTGLRHFTRPRGTENDIGVILNLLCDLPPAPGVAPLTWFENDSTKRGVRVLVIADSYYLNIIEPYGRKLFRSQEYWYYNKKLYPRHNVTPPRFVDKSDLLNKLKQFDLILLMSSEINLHCGFWSFPEEAWYAFHPWPPQRALRRIENDIRNDREWFSFMVAKAMANGKPLHEMISEDARYMFFHSFSEIAGKSYLDTIDYIGVEIRRTPEWFEAVKKKAESTHIPLDSMILLDAQYTYEQKRLKRWK